MRPPRSRKPQRRVLTKKSFTVALRRLPLAATRVLTKKSFTVAPRRLPLAATRVLTKKSFAVAPRRLPLAATLKLIMSLKKKTPKVILSPWTQSPTTRVHLILVLRRTMTGVPCINQNLVCIKQLKAQWVLVSQLQLLKFDGHQYIVIINLKCSVQLHLTAFLS